MPRAAAHPDPLGIRWGGQVLEGKRSVQDALYQIDWDVRAHLLKEARTRGCHVLSGVDMFVRQAALQFQLFTGKEAPLELMRKVVKRALSPIAMRDED